MSGSYPHDEHARGRFGEYGSGGGSPAGGIWEAMDQLRQAFEHKAFELKAAPRAGRGDVRAAVLSLLAEQPMHGYQIIHQIQDRSGGAWKPSPGSVYPTLQLLAHEGLIRAEAESGRKTYSLTDEGRAEVEASADHGAQWQKPGNTRASGMKILSKAGVELAQAAAQVGRSGSYEQIREAATEIDRTRRTLYSILARD